LPLIICRKSQADEPLCDTGSLSEIFENHHEGLSDADLRVRNGTGFRLQSQGSLWEHGLNTWLTDEKTKLKKEMTAERRQKNNKRAVQDSELVLPDRIEQKLKMGLGLLKQLAEALHIGVLAINPEPGCQINAGWKAEDSSLLVSSPCKLEPYPGSAARGL